MEVPAQIESYILSTYQKPNVSHWKNGRDLLDWYRRWAKYCLEKGIPVDGVIGLMKKHPIPIEMVRAYGFSSGLTPEGNAQHILNLRHNPVEYDSLAKPRVRVTKKKISEFRQNLEEELRKIWGDNKESLEEAIKEYCYQPRDEEIANYIRRGMKASNWAKNIYDYL